MNSRVRFLTILALLLLATGTAFFMLVARDREDLPIYSATIDRDCAPWDGAAFTVLIPLENKAVLNISIYRSPDIKLPVSFGFPDKTGRTGNVFLLVSVDVTEELSGNVSLQQITQESPVEGEFDLHAETGKQFKGKFIAEWKKETVMCG